MDALTLWFYLGQFGLFTAATFSIVIIHIVGQRENRPPWYYFLAVWAVAIACATLFGQPYVSPQAEFLPQEVYAIWFVFGLERIAVFISYRFQFGRSMDTYIIRRINVYVGVASVLAMVLFWGYGLTQQVSIAQWQTRQLQRQVGITAMQTRRQADSLLIAALRQSTDSNRAALRVSRNQVTQLTARLTKQEEQIDALIDLVQSVKSSVRRVDQRVERSRRQLPTPNLIPMEAPDPKDYLNRFQPVAPKQD